MVLLIIHATALICRMYYMQTLVLSYFFFIEIQYNVYSYHNSNLSTQSFCYKYTLLHRDMPSSKVCMVQVWWKVPVMDYFYYFVLKRYMKVHCSSVRVRLEYSYRLQRLRISQPCTIAVHSQYRSSHVLLWGQSVVFTAPSFSQSALDCYLLCCQNLCCASGYWYAYMKGRNLLYRSVKGVA